MSVNSITKYVDKNTAEAELKLLLSHPKSRNKIYVVVEGKDDVNFLNKFLDRNTIIIESYSGCVGVKEIVLNICNNKNNIIGICDRDYSENNIEDRIFFYDYCTLEIMIVSNFDVFESLYHEYYRGKTGCSELYCYIFKMLKLISIIRCENMRGNGNINFKSINYDSAYKNNNIDEFNKIILNILLDSSKENITVLLKNATKRCNNEKWTEEDYFNNTNGHDFFCLLKAILRKEDKDRKFNVDILSSTARCSYSEEKFIQTTLYNELKKYEKENNFKILSC